MPQILTKVPPGVSRGATPSTSAGRYYDANLVRWRGGHLQPVGGWQKLTTTAFTSTVRSLLSWRSTDEIGRTAAMADSKIFLFEGGTWSEIQPLDFVGAGSGTGGGYGVAGYGASTYGTPRATGPVVAVVPNAWSQASWGQQLLAVASTDGRLLKWDPAVGGRMTAVSGAPTNNQAMIVTPERHVLIAGAGGLPRRLAWCSREDYSDWNYASTTNTAGFLDIDTKGLLQCFAPVRNGTLMFSDDETWLVRYVGSPYIYGTERVGESCVPMSPEAVASFAGRAVWMGREGFWMYDGGAVMPLQCEVADYVFSRINKDIANARVVASSNKLFNEIWWHYPSGSNGENDSYVIWNYSENWWSIGTMGRTAASEGEIYDRPIAVGTDGHLYRHEVGWTANGTSRVGSVWAETGTISGGPGGAGDKVLIFRQAQLDDGFGYDAIRVRAYTRFTREGTERSYGPYIPRSSGYTDLRFTGRDIRLRFEATKDQDWEIGVCRFEAVEGGER